MNIPLSNSIGNALEVEEAISVLKGEKNRLYDVSKEIASILISLAKKITIKDAGRMHLGLHKLEEINAINTNPEIVFDVVKGDFDPEEIPSPEYHIEVPPLFGSSARQSLPHFLPPQWRWRSPRPPWRGATNGSGGRRGGAGAPRAHDRGAGTPRERGHRPPAIKGRSTQAHEHMKSKGERSAPAPHPQAGGGSGYPPAEDGGLSHLYPLFRVCSALAPKR